MINILLTAGIHYTAVSQTVKLAAGQSKVNVSIPIKDDDVAAESNVAFTIAIIPLEDVILLSSYPVVTIVDDDLSKLHICDKVIFCDTHALIIKINNSFVSRLAI